MSSPSPKTLSPAELAKLEHAFATDPSSDAYQPLAEAYLGMGRFMEAMVVCKKGVKAHPNSASPRLLLAQVYAAQGKDKKALEEAVSALGVAPSDKTVLRLAGTLQLKTGEVEPGKANLLKAYSLDPSDPETQALLSQHNIAPPAPADPPTEKVAIGTGAPVTNGRPSTQTSPHSRISAPMSAPPVLAAPSAADHVPAPTPPADAVAPPPAPRPAAPRTTNPNLRAAQPAAPRPAPRPPPRMIDEDDDAEDRAELRSAAKSSSRAIATLVAFVILAGSAVGYWWYGNWSATRNRAVKKNLGVAADLLKRDSYDSYQKATAAADKVLEVAPDSGLAHGYLAYAWTIRFGEHGGGDEARRRAEEHLQAAKEAGETSSHAIAASALHKLHLGKGAEALKELEPIVASYESQGKRSSLLYLALGTIQMSQGDLDKALENLEKAKAMASDDPRVYATLGNLYRRQGQDILAAQHYDLAVRYEKNHPESMLGAVLLMLEQDKPNYVQASGVLQMLLKAEPPPSPRQLAIAQAAKALLISRASRAPDLRPEQKAELERNGVPTDSAKAAEEIRKAELGSNAQQYPDIYLIRGRRLTFEGKHDEAANELRQAVKADPTRALFHIELARALMQKPGGEKDAATALQAALKTIPESPKLMTMLGHAYRKIGKTADAVDQYARATRDPKAKNPEARLGLGSIYREREDYAKAQAELEKAAQEYVGQPTRLAAVYTELGRVLEAKGDRTKADETYQRALNADPGYAPAYFHYAKFLAADPKNKDKAKEIAAEYVRRDPSGEFAAQAKQLAE